MLIHSLPLTLVLNLLLTPTNTHAQTSRSFEKRAIPATLPSGWISQGCLTDDVAARSLTGATFQSGAMTIESCINFCQSNSFKFAGVEYSQECYCDNNIHNTGASATLTDCNMGCSGNGAESCGGPNRMNVFSNGPATLPTGPTAPAHVGQWSSLGCYNDSVNSRTLGVPTAVVGQVSIDTCTTACHTNGFTIAGLEYSQECYCDNSFRNFGAPAPDGAVGCNMACVGNSSELCGGSNRLNVYTFNPSATGLSTSPTGTTATTTSTTTASTPTSPITPSQVGGWTSLGCYTDSVNARTLGTPMGVQGQVSVETCVTACQANNFRLAGVEFAQECYCDNSFRNSGGPAPDGAVGCNMACVGNSSEWCGGPNRLNVYNFTAATGTTGTTPTPTPGAPITPSQVGQWVSLGCFNDSVVARTLGVPMGTVGGNSVETCTTACQNAGYPLSGMEFAQECYCDTQFRNFGAPASDGAVGCNMACSGNSSEFCGGPDRLNVYNFTGTLTTTPGGNNGGNNGGNTGNVGPVTTGLPTPWAYRGCWVDNANGRILPTELPDNQTLTVESCINECIGQNFSVAGVEFGVQCFCGNEFINGATQATSDTQCNQACGGNSTEACGAGNRMSIYSTNSTITIVPVPTPQKTGLPGNWQYQYCLAEPGAPRIFPYQIILQNNNTAQNCLSLCSTYGYPAAGMEFGDECYCGDPSDITAAGGTQAPETDCAMACSGDPAHLCGGANRLTFYLWTGTPLNTWHTPAVTGQYEFLIGGLIVPLIATLGINNKVTFLEKWGTGPPNSTGAYELDLSLTSDATKAWREMHVQTDVFCSGGVTLPDKVGRQLNVGGWSLDSTFGVRLYWPDGSPGVNGTHDWQENFNELSLQKGRWYPGTMVMANGSVLVVGGEVGSNGAPEPSLEVLPRIPGGDTTITLDYLQRTDPNNLYPFLMVLPGGGIFILYYNEARILDETTFATTKILPNAPAAVNNFEGGRTYPMEGTSVLLPQAAPYTDPITVLTCGGSTPGAAIALDNCVSIQPEVANPTWTLERMPSKRVMTCMVALPDGTYLILNGAQQGVAGFGLATDPNLQAILYDPSQTVGSRMSILSSTIVARMYHSEAILLQDGRVLVSGSDPEDSRFPQEYRVEVYVPPYLSKGLTQPTFTITNTDWVYGGSYQINVQLFNGNTGTMKVSLLGSVTSTHGNSMGQRTIFPSFSCAGNTCTIVAPPNAHVCPPGWFQLFVLDQGTPSWSQWVRIGGDPAGLGNWPSGLSDFTPPGM